MTPSDQVLRLGRERALRAPRALRAGRLEAMLDGPDLRYVRVGGVEVVRRLFVAVRNDRWETLPGELVSLEVTESPERFAVEARVRHVQRDVDFEHTTTIDGHASGALSFAMQGTARADFDYNRIGLCILHPAHLYAGRRYRARTEEGFLTGRFPTLIAPQVIRDNTYFPLFPDCDALDVELAGDLSVSFAFAGDRFECEDQRNWTDSTIKTYAMPIGLGMPRAAVAGERIDQRVSVTPSGGADAVAAEGDVVRVRVGRSHGRSVPPLGFGSSSGGGLLTDRQARRLRALRPDHLRVEVDLASPRCWLELQRADASAQVLGCALEVFVIVRARDLSALGRLSVEAVRLRAPIARVIVLCDDTEVTPTAWVTRIRREIAAVLPGVPVGGGTKYYFTELNRYRPEPAATQVVAFSMNPQVHAADETSIVETLPVQGEVIESCRALVGDVPIAVSPITLKMRSWPYGEDPAGPGELPFPVDERQMSLFAAAWTACSIKHLAGAGADSLTYYETTGWSGLMEEDGGCALPGRFLSWPGCVFPVYHVFADLADARGGTLRDVETTDALAVDGVAVEHDRTLHVTVANLTPQRRRVLLEGLPSNELRMRVLDHTTAVRAMDDPDGFRQDMAAGTAPNGTVSLDIEPFGQVHVVCGTG